MMGPALVIALLFAPLAALMRFAISDGEYSRHYPDRRTPFLMSLQTALVIFVVFVLLALFAGWLMPRILSPVS